MKHVPHSWQPLLWTHVQAATFNTYLSTANVMGSSSQRKPSSGPNLRFCYQCRSMRILLQSRRALSAWLEADFLCRKSPVLWETTKKNEHPVLSMYVPSLMWQHNFHTHINERVNMLQYFKCFKRIFAPAFVSCSAIHYIHLNGHCSRNI